MSKKWLDVARTIQLHYESLMISESHNGLSLMPINDLSIPRVWLDVSGRYLREYFKYALNFL